MGLLADARTLLGLDTVFGPIPAASGRGIFDLGGIAQPLPVEMGIDPAVPTLPTKVAARPNDRPLSSTSTDRFQGGRASWDTPYQMLGYGTYVILPPDDSLEAWRTFDLDAKSIRGLSATRLLRILADASPDVSRALWDFLRMGNPGWQCNVYQIGDTKVIHKAGQAVVKDFLDRMADKYGSFDVLISKMYFSAFLFGMIIAEMVLDLDGRTAIDLATPDPGSIRFMLQVDPVLGSQWILGQFQGGRAFVPLTRETIKYIPIDPAPGQPPYGRPPAAPALFSSLFLLGMLQDLRRVVAQQGYPRYDLSVNLQKLQDSMPATLTIADPNIWKAWVNMTLNEVAGVYSSLTPDAAYIHSDVVTVNRPSGAVSTDALGSVDSLIRELERQMVRALKTMPLLMATAEGASEANANRQWEIYAAGVTNVQNLLSSILSRLMTLLCEANGKSARAEWTFSILRSGEEFRAAQTEAQKIQNEQNKWRSGWTSQEEASLNVTGHLPDQPQPREEPTLEAPYNKEPPPAPRPTTGLVTDGGGGAPDNPEVKDGKDLKGAVPSRSVDLVGRPVNLVAQPDDSASVAGANGAYHV